MPALRPARQIAASLARLALVALAAVALTACGGSSTDEATTQPATGTQETAVALVSPTEAQEAIDGGGVVVLDVRTPEEFAAGHVAGAENIDFYEEDFGARIDDLDHSAQFVVYCRSGNRSAQATAMMARRGFTDVSDVDGGIVAWEAAGLPTVTSG